MFSIALNLKTHFRFNRQMYGQTDTQKEIETDIQFNKQTDTQADK